MEWIECPQTEHMICSHQCEECLLLKIDSSLTEKLNALGKEVSLHDVTVIVSNISHNRRPEDNRIKEFIARSHPDVNVKVNFEMEGLEAPVVILVHNGEHLGSSISLGVSRATTKLIIMCSDDNNILINIIYQFF